MSAALDVPTVAEPAPRKTRRTVADVAPGFSARLRSTLQYVAGTSDKGWQIEAARKLDVHPVLISMWLRGGRSPSAPSLAAIALASGVSLDWLVFGSTPVSRAARERAS